MVTTKVLRARKKQQMGRHTIKFPILHHPAHLALPISCPICLPCCSMPVPKKLCLSQGFFSNICNQLA